MVKVSPASQSIGTAVNTFLASKSPPVDALKIPASDTLDVPDSPSAELKVASHSAVSPSIEVVVWVMVAVLRLISVCRAVSVADSAVVPVPMARYPNLSSVKPVNMSLMMHASPTFVIMFLRQYSSSTSFAGRLEIMGMDAEQFLPLHSFGGVGFKWYFMFPYLSLTMISTHPWILHSSFADMVLTSREYKMF